MLGWCRCMATTCHVWHISPTAPAMLAGQRRRCCGCSRLPRRLTRPLPWLKAAMHPPLIWHHRAVRYCSRLQSFCKLLHVSWVFHSSVCCCQTMSVACRPCLVHQNTSISATASQLCCIWFATALLRNCFASQLLCFATALQLVRCCFASQLLRNCFATASQLLRNCFVSQLLCNCSTTAV